MHVPFKPGDKKPKDSGMKKGQTTKKTVWLREALDSVGLTWQDEYKKAIEAKDYKLIELLHQLIPYLNPKIKEKEIITDEESENNNPELTGKTSEDLIKLIK